MLVFSYRDGVLTVKNVGDSDPGYFAYILNFDNAVESSAAYGITGNMRLAAGETENVAMKYNFTALTSGYVCFGGDTVAYDGNRFVGEMKELSWDGSGWIVVF
jgi:hypothetical protein